MRFRPTVLATAALLAAACGNPGSPPPPPPAPANATEIRVAVNAHGYEPAEASAPAGGAVRLVVTRTTDEGCGHEIAIPTLGIRRELPLNEPVAIDLTMPPSGRVRFTCGMDMYEGALVVR